MRPQFPVLLHECVDLSLVSGDEVVILRMQASSSADRNAWERSAARATHLERQPSDLLLSLTLRRVVLVTLALDDLVVVAKPGDREVEALLALSPRLARAR
jgi:hypothetical protein